MRQMGWYDKKNVLILEGKWQDFVESDQLLGIGGFDAIYSDTFSENYKGTLLNVVKYHPLIDQSVLVDTCVMGKLTCGMLQTCMRFLNTFQTSYEVQTRCSASSMVWGPPVCPSPNPIQSA